MLLITLYILCVCVYFILSIVSLSPSNKNNSSSFGENILILSDFGSRRIMAVINRTHEYHLFIL